jgi:hypothetical protein
MDCDRIVIDDIAPRWNHPVYYDPPLADDDVSILHNTTGGPYFDDYKAMWIRRSLGLPNATA